MKQQNTETPLEPSASAPALAVLHKDLFSLLTLIYAATTKLTLSLRAEEPAYRAALGPLQDLTTNISAIATCATLFDAHGLTLASDVKQVVREVCIALSALGHTLLVDGDDHLVHTGMVHELVDKAKRDLPADNRAAVKKRWASDRGMLEDSLQDVTSMIEDNDAEDEFDEFDDELDDLGLGSSKKMSEVELARTKKIQPLIRFTTLLHKRVQLDILAKPSLEPTSSVILDSLPSHSHAILVALEDTVATLYAPQDPSAIASAISPLAKSIEELRSALSPMLPPALSATEVASGGASTEARGPQKDVRKWFTACFDQIDRLSHNLRDALAQESSNST
ncbi:uncharacterized protein C8Q71DRAFT_699863 [Rhodofomes roseus]|uniref:Uncharacterized protein n=1 Tax=Rhodofomes roseus TaxID=34475 RepID=A0ABQ8KVL2_9APHY|nr:uncharacterized protein C8Q71DRAFT_699863 [Rhodofomes roseus]KAH9843081.1 hypothetical protein C8Q71DRAFT_699863 [Rhodofomes roseus]